MKSNPLIVLGPGRSFTTVLTAMLGQHPQMYGFPETNLLMTRTIAEWLDRFGHNFLSQGLLRLVAELVVGVQTEESVRFARRWLMRRRHRSSTWVFCELAERVSPRMPIDKSPAMVKDVGSMRLALEAFPAAQFLHVTRHPIDHGSSLLKLIDECLVPFRGLRPFAEQMLMRSPVSPLTDMVDRSGDTPTVDPQLRWFKEHSNILVLLADVPPLHQMRICGEDLLANPDLVLPKITDWLGFRSDKESVECMKHPENSCFASIGPRNAMFGNDPNFCREPALRATRPKRNSLDGTLPWKNSAGIRPEVKRLAEKFGYN